MASARVELYATPFCVLCERSRQLLEHAGIAFTEIDLMTALRRSGRLAEYRATESMATASADR